MHDYQKAYDEARWVIDNKGTFNYALEPDFQNLFRAELQDGLKETIFSLDFPGLQNGNGGANDDIMPPMTGIRGADELGWSVCVPSMAVYNSWNDQDYRKKEIRVVLGAEFTPTPVFHDTLEYIVFSPTWSVPTSIFKKEFLPKLQENPAHFDPERFTFYKDGEEIDPLDEDWNDRNLDSAAYRVIENPGEVNSLGNVKFIMPNNFSVYLHDTPADGLFKQEERALSHGCIRLEKPLEFAAYLLSGQKDWDEKRIRAAMASGKPLKVDLEGSFPVYIVYCTTWVDEDNALHFRHDVYGHDQRHLAYLQKE